jgi:hypothetical protein
VANAVTLLQGYTGVLQTDGSQSALLNATAAKMV